MSLIVVQTQMKRELLNRKIGQNKLSIIQHKETKKKRKYRNKDILKRHGICLVVGLEIKARVRNGAKTILKMLWLNDRIFQDRLTKPEPQAG